ncbi:MAG TPA: alpha/beta hydrolase [Anaerolineae bacterium]|nr:alpha/beta hydrolase [Anaerolineae bacterium]
MPFAFVRGQHLWYEESGQGDAMLLLHGYTGTARADLGAEIDYFRQFYRVVAPDLRGYGRSEPKPRQFPADFYVQDALDVGALLDSLSISQAHVLGYSDGGESALLVAIERPDLARSVTAWGVIGGFGPEIKAIAESQVTLDDLDERRPGLRVRIVELHGEQSLAPMVEGWSAAVTALVAAGGDVSLGRAHTIRCPVLLINGEHDQGNPEYLARQLAARIPFCTFEVWLGLGHPVHREAPDAFHARVLDFVRRVA